MGENRIRVDQIKVYSLELYGERAEDLLLKVDSDNPFTPMTRGDRIQALDAPGAREDEAREISGIEHVIWSAGDQVRYVTRIFTRPAPPLG